jgi:hypothetical protein
MSSAGCDGLRGMTERDPLLEPFDALIGTWATEATHPLADEVVLGSITFEWLEGGRFLIQRSRNHHELFPDAICHRRSRGRRRAGHGVLRLARRSNPDRPIATLIGLQPTWRCFSIRSQAGGRWTSAVAAATLGHSAIGRTRASCCATGTPFCHAIMQSQREVFDARPLSMELLARRSAERPVSVAFALPTKATPSFSRAGLPLQASPCGRSPSSIVRG